MTKILQLKVSLNEIQPEIWRTVLVEDSISFEQLHQIIQRVFGWEDYHLYKFAIGNEIIMPDEEHYIIPRLLITNVFSSKAAFKLLSLKETHVASAFISCLYENCGVDANAHGIGGSSALGCRVEGSDFDWVIYTEEHVEELENYLETDILFKRAFSFGLDYAVKKYRMLSALSDPEIISLIQNKRRYYSFMDNLFSITFVSPHRRADNFLCDPVIAKEVTIVRGHVENSYGADSMPRLIHLREEKRGVFTWLFMYGGAFHKDDYVEALGIPAPIDGKEYILLQGPQHYAKAVTR